MQDRNFDDDPEEWVDGYDTPQAAVLSGSPPQAEARMLSSTISGDDAMTVHIEVGGHSIDEFCERHNGQWFNVGRTGC